MCLPTMVRKLLLAQQLKLRSVPMPTSINKNENVKEVELKTNVGTLTISDAAWNDMTAKATEVDKTASVVIKLEDKSEEGSNPVYEVTATVGEENASTVAAMAL